MFGSLADFLVYAFQYIGSQTSSLVVAVFVFFRDLAFTMLDSALDAVLGLFGIDVQTSFDALYTTYVKPLNMFLPIDEMLGIVITAAGVVLFIKIIKWVLKCLPTLGF